MFSLIANNSPVFITFLYIKMGSSELRPSKVKIMSAHLKNTTTTVNVLHITTMLVFVPTKTSLMAMIFIS